jgi:Domain of unknown function (DUF4340)
MKLKVLALGSGILVLLAVAAFAFNRWINEPSGLGRVGQPLMAAVQPEQVRRIEIVSPENKVTLDTRDGTIWTVAQQHEFPVDSKKIKALFLKLTTVKLAHKITDSKDKLAALGVLTAEENDGKLEKDKTGRRLILYGQGDKPLFSLVLGNDRRGQGASGFGGTYVRYPDQNAAYLISDAVLVDQRPQDWIDGAVLEVDADQTLQSVQVRQEGKRAVELSHDKAGAPWRLAGMPQPELDEAAVRSLIGQLASLDIFKVAAGDAEPASVGRKKTGKLEFAFFDKRRFTLDIGEAKAPDEFRYVSLHAELDPAVKDETLHGWVDSFNERFGGRLLAVYDWDGARMLQDWAAYKKKPAKKD